MTEPHFDFRPLRRDDVPLLYQWLQRPHVAEWWDGVESLEDVESDFFPAVKVPTDASYFAYLDSRPVAYVQSYAAVETPDGWWVGQHDPACLGIDQFLADPGELGRGLGTALVTQFTRYLFRDPEITRIQVDPAPANGRAIRCYEKAGFRRVSEVDTPDGRALVMVLERGDAL